MAPRAKALAELKAMVGKEITPTAPTAPDQAAIDFDAAARKLTQLDALAKLGVIEANAKELTDAIQAAKDAKAAMEKS